MMLQTLVDAVYTDGTGSVGALYATIDSLPSFTTDMSVGYFNSMSGINPFSIDVIVNWSADEDASNDTISSTGAFYNTELPSLSDVVVCNGDTAVIVAAGSSSIEPLTGMIQTLLQHRFSPVTRLSSR